MSLGEKQSPSGIPAEKEPTQHSQRNYERTIPSPNCLWVTSGTDLQ